MNNKGLLTLNNPEMKIISLALNNILATGTDRMQIQFTQEGNKGTCVLEAKDTIALRAGLNSFMNLYNLSDNIIKGILYGRK